MKTTINYSNFKNLWNCVLENLNRNEMKADTKVISIEVLYRQWKGSLASGWLTRFLARFSMLKEFEVCFQGSGSKMTSVDG